MDGIVLGSFCAREVEAFGHSIVRPADKTTAQPAEYPPDARKTGKTKGTLLSSLRIEEQEILAWAEHIGARLVRPEQ